MKKTTEPETINTAEPGRVAPQLNCRLLQFKPGRGFNDGSRWHFATNPAMPGHANRKIQV